ncbi:MAG: MFS transporter [Anaerolineae bacterium]|nr:MFS transporter [Anaerolineae bacterium]
MRSTWHRGVTLNLYWLGHSFMWGSIHPILLPMLLLGYTDHAKNTAYGMLTFAGLIIALVVQPMSGALSDRTRHTLGRRRPWMIVGGLFVLVSLTLMILARRFWLVACAYLVLQFFSNLAHGPAQGLIPDLVLAQQRGLAAGLKNLADMLGIILAAGVAGRLMSTTIPRSALLGVVIMALYLTATLITIVGAKETPSSDLQDEMPRTVSATVDDLLAIDMRQNRSYGQLLLSRFFMLFGSFSIQSFILYYFRDALSLDSPARAVGRMMTVVGLSIVLVVYPAGALSERWGRKRLAILACGMAALGLGMISFARSTAALYAVAGLVGLGVGIFSSVNWAWAVDLVPSGEAGKYLGLTNLATAGSAAVARLFGPVIDLVNRWVPNGGYAVLFALAALAALLGLILTLNIPDKKQSGPASRGPLLSKAR